MTLNELLYHTINLLLILTLFDPSIPRFTWYWSASGAHDVVPGRRRHSVFSRLQLQYVIMHIINSIITSAFPFIAFYTGLKVHLPG